MTNEIFSTKSASPMTTYQVSAVELRTNDSAKVASSITTARLIDQESVSPNMIMRPSLELRPIMHGINTIGVTPTILADGVERDKLTQSISPLPNPNDTLIFEHPIDSAVKYYLPRYRLRSQVDRYEIGVNLMSDGKWQLTIGLEKYPAPELGAATQGCQELPHTVTVILQYLTGESYKIFKSVNFVEIINTEKGINVSTSLTLPERDFLLLALKTPSANSQLVVQRKISVAVKIADKDNQSTSPIVHQAVNFKGLMPIYRAKAAPDARLNALSQNTLSLKMEPVKQVDRSVQPIKFVQFVEPVQFVPLQPLPIFKPIIMPQVGAALPLQVLQPQPVDRYRIMDFVLSITAEPRPLFLDEHLHRYLYDSATTTSGNQKTEFRRIPVAYPIDLPSARFYTYLQDTSEPWVFYYLPDEFKLAREKITPFRPCMNIATMPLSDNITNVHVGIDFVVAPEVNYERLKAAKSPLASEIPAGASKKEVVFRPLQTKASFMLRLPTPTGPAFIDQEIDNIDLMNGFIHNLTIPIEYYGTILAAVFAQETSSLLSGQVIVETGLSNPEIIPIEIRFADTEGEVLTFTEQPGGVAGSISIMMVNAIESPVRIPLLSVKLRRETGEIVNGIINGTSFSPPLELASGASATFTIQPETELRSNEKVTLIFNTLATEVLPDQEAILKIIIDTSIPYDFTREIEVMTTSAVLGSPENPESIETIIVEFQNNLNITLNHDQLSHKIKIPISLLSVLLPQQNNGNQPAGNTYHYKLKIIKRNGSRFEDTDWRESSEGILLLPPAILS